MKKIVQKFARFPNFFFIPIVRFLLLVLVGSQTYRFFFIFSYFHIGTRGQICQNHFRDDSHFNYTTKLEKTDMSHRSLESKSSIVYFHPL